MLATRRLLAQIFASERDDELITTPARRKVLREHLYRELAKETYPLEERQRWAERLQRLLDGTIRVDLRCRLVDVRLGVDDASLQSRGAIALEDDETSVQVYITQLNHKRLDALVQKAAEERPEDEESPAEERNTTPPVVSLFPQRQSQNRWNKKHNRSLEPRQMRRPGCSRKPPKTILSE